MSLMAQEQKEIFNSQSFVMVMHWEGAEQYQTACQCLVRYVFEHLKAVKYV
jgi:hypothetical protein